MGWQMMMKMLITGKIQQELKDDFDTGR